MRSIVKSAALALLTMGVSFGLLAVPSLAKAAPGYTGTVTDSMCGAHHPAGQDPGECTRVCIKKGQSYALAVGDKVYTLKGGDAAELDKLAGKKATVEGTLSDNTLEVTAITAAK